MSSASFIASTTGEIELGFSVAPRFSFSASTCNDDIPLLIDELDQPVSQLIKEPGVGIIIRNCGPKLGPEDAPMGSSRLYIDSDSEASSMEIGAPGSSDENSDHVDFSECVHHIFSNITWRVLLISR